MTNNIDIGFVEKCEAWKLESRFFPSKVGGKPAWLNLQNLPTVDDIICDICKNPCIFLCQIYAPYEDNPQAFHRTLYVFVCKNGDCCKPCDNGNFKIFRCQLPRENTFYPFQPPEEQEHWRPDIQADKWVNVCHVCGILATKHCAKCKSVNYCCRNHQIVDWKAGHKHRCEAYSSGRTRNATKSGVANDTLFSEFNIIIETENEDEIEDATDDSVKETEEMKYFQSLVDSGKAGTLYSENDVDTDLRNMSKSENDETFTNFREKIKENPDQILRYDRGGTPLFISSGGQPLNIPKCQRCNGERHFEFQIMPQLLNHLGCDDANESLDWGTLLIYTCENSCSINSGYTSEFIWKQDIAVTELSE